MMNRAASLERFIHDAGWNSARRAPLKGDASRRSYTRLHRDNGETAMLMDAPPEAGEDVRPFVKITRYLQEQGLTPPNILAEDQNAGFLLLEDLGDGIYARLLEKDPGQELTYYTAAADVLAHLHEATTPQLEPYNAQVMTDLAGLAFDWYQLGAKGCVNEGERKAFSTEMFRLLEPLDATRQVVVLRDYHAENLLWLPDRDGLARVGLLDYQDAMLGHPAYDLVSVLRDARRDVSPMTEAEVLRHYIRSTQTDEGDFLKAYALLGVQRNVRILFIFARMSMAFAKPHYVDLIPRVWNHIVDLIDRPELATLGDTIFAALPEPTPDILERLKDQCGTHPLP